MIKFNKIPIFLITCVLIITLAFGIWKLVSSVDEKNDGVKISARQMYIVNIYGTEGEGFVDLTFNEEYINSFTKNDGTALAITNLDISISKENNLSNGDKFDISINNTSELEDMGISFDNASITYSVSGLKQGTDFDVFADLKIYIDDGQIVLDNSGCSNFVKDDVEFFIKNGTLSYKEGDTVIIGAYIDMNAATDNGYNIKVTEKEYNLTEQESNQ